MGQTLGFKQHSFLPASAPGEGSALPQVLYRAHPCGAGRPHMHENHPQTIRACGLQGSYHPRGSVLWQRAHTWDGTRCSLSRGGCRTKTSEEKVHAPPGCPWSASELLPSGGALLPLLQNMEAMAAPSVLGQEDPGVVVASSLTLHFSRRVPRAEHPSTAHRKGVALHPA